MISPNQNGDNEFTLWFYVKNAPESITLLEYEMRRPAGPYGKDYELVYASAEISYLNESHCLLTVSRDFRLDNSPVEVEVPLNIWIKLKFKFGYDSVNWESYMRWYYDSGGGETLITEVTTWSNIQFSDYVTFGSRAPVTTPVDVRVDYVRFTSTTSWLKDFEVSLDDEWIEHVGVSRVSDITYSGSYSLSIYYPS
jgi:hypothetical protein